VLAHSAEEIINSEVPPSQAVIYEPRLAGSDRLASNGGHFCPVSVFQQMDRMEREAIHMCARYSRAVSFK